MRVLPRCARAARVQRPSRAHDFHEAPRRPVARPLGKDSTRDRRLALTKPSLALTIPSSPFTCAAYPCLRVPAVDPSRIAVSRLKEKQMQKNLIALALAGLAALPAFAQSNVTIYGLVDMGYKRKQGTDPTLPRVERRQRFQDVCAVFLERRGLSEPAGRVPQPRKEGRVRVPIANREAGNARGRSFIRRPASRPRRVVRRVPARPRVDRIWRGYRASDAAGGGRG